MHHFILSLSHILGINDEGTWYNFWSGIGSDLGELTIVGAILNHLRVTKQHHEQQNQTLKRHIDYELSKLTDEKTN